MTSSNPDNCLNCIPDGRSGAIGIEDTHAHPKFRPAHVIGRIAIVFLTFWALALIVPEIYRVAVPLATFGLSTNNDGLIYDVVTPFDSAALSPAAEAGVVPGDRIDISRMRCNHPASPVCASVIAVLGDLGGLQYTRSGVQIAIDIVPLQGPERVVHLTAAPAPLPWLTRMVLLADTVVGTLFILIAANLVWTRPGAMTWGFFLYAIWFNPGQVYAVYVLLQPWPIAMLAEQAAEALAQGAAYAGLLVFALRFPGGKAEPAWRALDACLPWFGAGIAALSLYGGADLFGFKTEWINNIIFCSGFLLAAVAIALLLLRRHALHPQDEARMRWAIAGCAIGLPAFLIAELCQSSSLPFTLLGFSPSQTLIGLLYLLQGVIAYFVGTAVRRRRVVSVNIPLRRGAILAALTFILGVPVVYFHEVLHDFGSELPLPEWVWPIIAGPILLIGLSRLHDLTVEYLERVFNRPYHRAREQLAQAGAAIMKAGTFDEIDRLLTEMPASGMRLSSAAVFRSIGGILHRSGPAIGWESAALKILDRERDALVFQSLVLGAPLALPRGRWQSPGLPEDDNSPCLAVPINGGISESLAVLLFGPHVTGNDIDHDERQLLRKLATQAAMGYDRIETETLRRENSELRAALAAAQLAVKPEPGG